VLGRALFSIGCLLAVLAAGCSCERATFRRPDAGLDAARDAAGLDALPLDAASELDAPADARASIDAPAPGDAARDARIDAPRDARIDAPPDTGPPPVGCPPNIGLYATDDMAAHVTVRDFLLTTTGIVGSVTIGGPVMEMPGPPVVPARIPTLSELLAYDALFVWGSGSWDGTAFGNVLADYVDTGRGVVIAVFAQRDSPSVGVFGRMSTGGYLPYTPGGYQFAPVGLGAVAMPTHPIMAGITTFRGPNIAYHDVAHLPAATLVASFDIGRPLVATRQVGAGRTVLLGFYPVRFWDTSTDGERLMANALRWAAGCP
jgi:hypothetical protein